MDITYETLQWRIEDLHGLLSGPHQNPPPPPPPVGCNKEKEYRARDYTSGDYRPTWLLRTSDWQKVPGHQAVDGYCALSYNWAQSGDMIQTENDTCVVDNGRHRVKRQQDNEQILKETIFDNVIRQICKDFGIDYIWYDKVGIDQADKSVKQREIQHMYLIYSNAMYTVALIPELNVTRRTGHHGSDINVSSNIDAITSTEWSTRMWIIEEAFVSEQILFVGQNVHMWSSAAEIGIISPGSFSESYYFLFGICSNVIKWNVSTLLWYAHRSTTSIGHDWAFAISNIMERIRVIRVEIDYDQPLLDLLLYLYSHLADIDISILCFGACNLHDQWIRYPRPEDALLPSWTGIEGMHIPQSTTRKGFLQSLFADITIDGTSMHVRSDVIPITIELVHNSTDTSTASPFGSPYNSGEYPLFCLDDGSGCKSMKFIISDESEDKITKNLTGNYGLKATHWLPIIEGKDTWINTTSSPTLSGGYLSLTDKNCSQCFILASIRFDLHDPEFEALPVVKQEGNYYKSIGLCFLWDFVQIECNIIRAGQDLVIM